MKNQKGFYDKYLEVQKKNKKIENAREKYNINENEQVVIEDKNLFDRILFHIGIIIYWIFKVILFVVIFALSTVGATVLLNEPLRNAFLELVMNVSGFNLF